MKRLSPIQKATVVFLLLFVFLGCTKEKDIKKLRVEDEKFLFGTYIKIIVYDENQEKARNAIETAFLEIERVDKKFNSKNPESIIYKLNNEKSLDSKKIFLDEEGIEIFEKIRKIYYISDRKYDITIAPLMKLWGFEEGAIPHIPEKEELKIILPKINFEKVKIEKNELILEKPVEEIDTGSFLKGYALEKAKEKMKEKGIKSGFLSSISSIATIGGKPDGSGWKIGIQNPEKTQEIMGVVELKDQCLGVSGDYQTFVEINGEKYHHILDKDTGYQINDKKLVAVIGNNGFDTDIYSTALFLMEPSKIISISEENGLDTLIVNSKMEIIKSKNFNLKQ